MIDTHHDILKLMQFEYHFLDAGDDANHGAKLAELRLDSEIIGNFRNFEKFFDHFVERQK